jgi:hypothetical protein
MILLILSAYLLLDKIHYYLVQISEHRFYFRLIYSLELHLQTSATSKLLQTSHSFQR